MSNTCLHCGAELKGRADKKYCDESCRNSYHNEKNSVSNNYMRKVNRILSKNRQILIQELGDNENKKTPKDKLLREGFDFNYYTHTYTNKKGQVYYFVYEYGYLPLEADWVLIVVQH